MFSNFFKKHSALDEVFAPWSVSFAHWVVDNFGGLGALQDTPLVLPTKEFFPDVKLNDEAYAQFTLDQIKRHAGMKDWGCDLIAQQTSVSNFLGDHLQNVTERAPLGTFSTDHNRCVTITYDPELVSKPQSLIATLAHELAHYKILTSLSPPPDGWEEEEAATDGLAIFMGFGVFIANDNFNFNIDDRSWGYQRRGYLCEGEILHALSAFLILAEKDCSLACQYLKPDLAKRLRKTYTQMQAQSYFAD